MIGFFALLRMTGLWFVKVEGVGRRLRRLPTPLHTKSKPLIVISNEMRNPFNKSFSQETLILYIFISHARFSKTIHPR